MSAKIGDVFTSPASDYKRVVQVTDIVGDYALVENVNSGRRGRIHLKTLARWTPTPLGAAATAKAAPEGT